MSGLPPVCATCENPIIHTGAGYQHVNPVLNVLTEHEATPEAGAQVAREQTTVHTSVTGITDDMIEDAGKAMVRNTLGSAYPGDRYWDEYLSDKEQGWWLRQARCALEAGLAGRMVVGNPAPLAFQDEHSDVKTWEPDGVNFQVNFHPADDEKDAEVSFAYWQISPQHARGLGEAFIAASLLDDQPASGVAGGGARHD